MAKLILNVRIQDPMSGFFAIRKEAYEKVRAELDPRGFKIMLEILSLLILLPGIRIAETGIVFAMRKHGASKLSTHVILQYLLMLKNSFLKQRKLKKTGPLSAHRLPGAVSLPPLHSFFQNPPPEHTRLNRTRNGSRNGTL